MMSLDDEYATINLEVWGKLRKALVVTRQQILFQRWKNIELSSVSHSSSIKMHIRLNIRRIFLLFLLQTLLTSISHSKHLYLMQSPRKCCASGYLFNEQLTCVNRTLRESDLNSTKSTVVKTKETFMCNHNDSLIYDTIYKSENSMYVTLHVPNNFCIDDVTNGTKILAKCPDGLSHILGLDKVIMWGAKTYLSTNLAHVILCIIVVTIYLSVPKLRRGLYNRAVVRHNICLMMHGVMLQLVGFCELGNCQFNDNLMIFFWLWIQYFTISTVFWLNVICFDMTLVITRFHWIADNGKRSEAADNRKLCFYGIFAWGGSFLPVLMAGLCDYISGIPDDFVLKPNYVNFRNGASFIINAYFFFVPTFTLVLNNVLFVFTTYKIFKIQRSTEMATRNQKNMMKKRYFLFLRLYLLMGAPWFFGMLFASFNNLVVLKTCRLAQPSLWLLITATHPAIISKIKGMYSRYRRPQTSVATIST